MKYFWIREDWRRDHTISSPVLDNDEIDFCAGQLITEPLPKPLVFDTFYGPGSHPHHYFDYATDIPVVSALFIDALKKCGVDNFQLFPAVIRNSKEKIKWEEYFAFNVIGMINATDLENSEYTEIMPGNDDDIPPLGSFTVIALHEDRIKGQDMFREPVGGNLIMSERVARKLVELKPENGFGFIADEVTLT